MDKWLPLIAVLSCAAGGAAADEAALIAINDRLGGEKPDAGTAKEITAIEDRTVNVMVMADLADPPGASRLHSLQQARDGDPEIASRVAQHEMAFRMQASVPEITDLYGESAAA